MLELLALGCPVDEVSSLVPSKVEATVEIDPKPAGSWDDRHPSARIAHAIKPLGGTAQL